MSGQRTGVSKLIQELESLAVKPHVDGHTLNLTASGMLKQCAVFKDAMSTSHELRSHQTESIRPRGQGIPLLQSTWDDAKDVDHARYGDEDKNSRRYVSNEEILLPSCTGLCWANYC